MSTSNRGSLPKVFNKKGGRNKNKDLVDLYNKVYEFMRDEDKEIADEMGDTVSNLKVGTSKSQKIT